MTYTLIMLMLIAFCNCDYYSILGITRTASERDIKRAFKKMSLKYHPDKNKNRPEWAKKHFVEIANAYEVLNDKEKRKIYDQKGEEGVKDYEQRKNQGSRGWGDNSDYDDIFQSFFRGGGQRRQHGYEDEDEDDGKSLFENSDVLKLQMSNLSHLYRRNEVWFVLFFKTNNHGIKELIDMWKTLAEKVYGIFKIAYVNCKSDDEICDEFSIRETPQIVYFPESSNDEEVYRGLKKWESVFQFGAARMQSFVRVINNDNYGDFVTTNPTAHKVLLFTQKKATPPLYKAISKHYHGKLYFGEIRSTEQELIQRFSVKKFPSLVIVTDSENYVGAFYEGAFNRDSIGKFLGQYAYSTIKAEVKAIVRELTSVIYDKEKMCSDKDGKNICLLYIIYNTSEVNGQINKMLDSLAEKYKNDPIKVYYLLDEKYKHFWSAFGEEEKGKDVLLVKGKRKRYTSLKFSTGNYETTFVEISNLVDNVISGGGRFQKMHKRLNLHTAKIESEKEDL